jgi:integrase
MSPVGFRRMLERLGKAAKMAFGVHPHMLRHVCGFKLANQGIIRDRAPVLQRLAGWVDYDLRNAILTDSAPIRSGRI